MNSLLVESLYIAIRTYIVQTRKTHICRLQRASSDEGSEQANDQAVDCWNEDAEQALNHATDCCSTEMLPKGLRSVG